MSAFQRPALPVHNNHRFAGHGLAVVRGTGRNFGGRLPLLRVLECEIHLRGVQRVYPVAIGLSEPSIREPSERANLRASLDRA